MADINLLQSTKQNSPSQSTTVKVLNIIGPLFLLLVLGFWAFLFLQSGNDDKTIVDLSQQQDAMKQQIVSTPGYTAFINEQNKANALKAVLSSHLDWSNFLPQMFAATLKTASYTSFQAGSDGSLLVDGVVPNFQELDKLIQGYQLADFKSLINDVKLIGVGFTESGQTKFSLAVTFNSKVLQASAAASNNSTNAK